MAAEAPELGPEEKRLAAKERTSAQTMVTVVARRARRTPAAARRAPAGIEAKASGPSRKARR